ncbi:MAG: VanW family protein [Chryseobacterium jejuense]|uniref:VanW family protein n=1 Tax=Chryseobacterium jejuense TaxID=445960 RepID=UPI003D0D4377
MKQQLKNWIPHSLKLQIKLLQRYLDEQKNNYTYPQEYRSENIGEYSVQLKQVIKSGAFHHNKIHNLKVVGDKIHNLILHPGEVFSFWKMIGKPSAKNNFKEGRNLINNTISSDFGGGICQFSSILYYLALQSGLKVLERYPHSMDIYKEEERFTPLGSDCTVVYGYKDLQIQNSFPFPVQFKCEIQDDELCLSLISPKEVILNEIEFKYHEIEKGVWVETVRNSRTLFKNFYIRL